MERLIFTQILKAMILRPRRLLVPLLLGFVLAGISLQTSQGAVINAKNLRGATATSTNWAGYAVTLPLNASATTPAIPTPATTFGSVSARWKQPAVACTKSKPTFSAFWVGLGGFSPASQALEQIGTTANCTTGGKAKYSMWYELVPAASVTIKFRVFPGNAITASVKVNGTQVTLQIRNLTRRTKFTKTLFVAAPDVSSAEWIAEAPSACDTSGRCEQLPLANFRTMTFTQATASTVDGHTGTITDATWSPTLVELRELASGPFADPATATGALPSRLSTTGASFAISYQRNIPAPTP